MMIINGVEEVELWKKIQNSLETYLKRNLTNELIPNTVLDVLEKQQKEIEELKKTCKELKYKKDIPTVIEYQGRRYVLDNGKR